MKKLSLKIYALLKMIGKVKWALLPFFLITFVIPVVRLRITIYHNEEMRQALFISGTYYDYFHLIKVGILYFSMFLFLLFFLFPQKKKYFPKIFYVLIPYYLLLFLSTYFSPYRISSLFGIFDHYEGFLTQICYLGVLIFSYYMPSEQVDYDENNIIRDGNRNHSEESDIIICMKMALYACVIVAGIGFFQFIGFEPLQDNILGTFIKSGAPGFNSITSVVSSTIGNSNYTGTYGSMLLPIALSVYLLESTPIKKIANGILLYGASLFLLFGSMSRAGFIAFLIIIPSAAVLLRKKIKEQAGWVISLILYGIAIFVFMNTVAMGFLVQEFRSMNPFIREKNEKLIFEDIELEGNKASIKTNQWFLKIISLSDGFQFLDADERQISIEHNIDSGHIKLNEEQYQGIQVYTQKKSDIQWLMLEMEGKDLELVTTDKGLKVVGFNRQLTDVVLIESARWIRNEAFASGRGYIWSRSVPLLKKAIFLGYGHDTFTFIFPQNDIIGKLNYGAIWAIITKPHNWYLQIALGSGLLSLFCLIILLSWYCIKTLSVFLKKGNETSILSVGIFLAVISYLITGIFNDSVVSVSPIFWMLLGFGIRRLKVGK